MNLTAIIPHFREGRTTEYCVSQLLKYSEGHDLMIIVGDNSNGEGMEWAEKYKDKILVYTYDNSAVQSHGVLIEAVLCARLVQTDFFLTLESDSHPVKEGWIDYYEKLANDGYDMAGSILQLSGGEYLHPCGTLYRKSLWDEARKYCESLPYTYFPNMAMKENFPMHLMIHNSVLNDVLSCPDDFIILSDDYKPYSAELAIKKADYYSPIGKGVFHNGVGRNDESIRTYGFRTAETEKNRVILDNKQKLIYRAGAEPGQYFHWYSVAMNKKIYNIPCETKWMEGKVGIQQEYTLMESGIKHLWAGTSYLFMKDTAQHDIYEFKKKQIEELTNNKS